MKLRTQIIEWKGAIAPLDVSDQGPNSRFFLFPGIMDAAALALSIQTVVKEVSPTSSANYYMPIYISEAFEVYMGL